MFYGVNALKAVKNITARKVPDDIFRLNRLTKNEKLLKSAAIDGAEKTFELFNEEYDTTNILRY